MSSTDTGRPIISIGSDSRMHDCARGNPGIRREVHFKGGTGHLVGLTVSTFDPNVACDMHNHWAGEELFLVLAGSGWITVKAEVHPVNIGDSVLVPPRYMHAIKAGPNGLKIASTLVRAAGHTGSPQPWLPTDSRD